MSATPLVDIASFSVTSAVMVNEIRKGNVVTLIAVPVIGALVNDAGYYLSSPKIARAGWVVLSSSAIAVPTYFVWDLLSNTIGDTPLGALVTTAVSVAVIYTAQKTLRALGQRHQPNPQLE